MALPTDLHESLQALEDAQITQADVHTVEVVGGSSRVPALLRIIKDFFGKEPGRTLNAKECVSRGAALNCAMLSPIFRSDSAVVVTCLTAKALAAVCSYGSALPYMPYCANHMSRSVFFHFRRHVYLHTLYCKFVRLGMGRITSCVFTVTS